jgi:hypothetical protein
MGLSRARGRLTRALAAPVLAALALFCAAPADLFAQAQQYGQPGNTYVTWGGTTNTGRIDVTYFIGAGFTGNMPNLIRQAAAQWSAAGSYINLVEVGSAAAANVRLSMANLPAVAALSQITRNTVVQPGTINGQPWARIQNPETITVNSAFAFWDGVGPQAGNQFDFQAVILDLMGYSIGLGFVVAGTDPTSAQQPQFNSGVPGNHVLSASDVQSINAVYGSPEPETWSLFGIGLALVASLKLFRRGAAGV